ncbi:hypothetical protein [Microseira wollei]|uniref:hypothetical protein n=1 Tax=Microseira wollei TaxID=467598 RepID=UPI001CFD49B2|nr:hypothetical protein [Microseira wollei]
MSTIPLDLLPRFRTLNCQMEKNENQALWKGGERGAGKGTGSFASAANFRVRIF